MKTIYLCYPGGRFKALSFSYDDGREADRRLVELFNAKGLKASFHLNGGLLGQDGRIAAKDVARLYQGHEVACHTLTHPTIARCPRELIARQLLDDRAALEDLLGYTVRGLSYPNGSHNAEIEALLPLLGFAYGRIVPSTGGFSLPEDPYRWAASCHHNHKLKDLAADFLDLKKSQYLYLMYVWGHSYEFDKDDNWELMESVTERLGGRDDIWYATNIEIIDYLERWRAMRFSANCELATNPSAEALWLTVDGKPMEIPPGATIRL